MRPRRAGHSHIAMKFKRETIQEIFVRQRKEIGAFRGAGVIDQDVQLAERIGRRPLTASSGRRSVRADPPRAPRRADVRGVAHRFAATSSSFVRSRATRQTCTPSRASSIALAAPIPRLAPVISATFPVQTKLPFRIPRVFGSTSMPGLAKRSNVSRQILAIHHMKQRWNAARNPGNLKPTADEQDIPDMSEDAGVGPNGANSSAPMSTKNSVDGWGSPRKALCFATFRHRNSYPDWAIFTAATGLRAEAAKPAASLAARSVSSTTHIICME